MAPKNFTSTRNLIILTVILIFVVSAVAVYGVLSLERPTPTPTWVLPTVESLTPAATWTPETAATPSPTASLIARATPTPAVTAATGTPTVLPITPWPTSVPLPDAEVLAEALNVRTGPAVAYPVIAAVPRGTTFQVLARTSDSRWLYVCCAADRSGWIANQGDLVQVYVDLATVPVVDLPTPTPLPPTATPVPTWTPWPTPWPTATLRPTATPAGGWFGEYFGNRNLLGSPWTTRYDGDIRFNWGTGSPAPGLPVDNFSVRWTRNLRFDQGQYQFFVRVDDGARVWVGGQLVIDAWREGGLTTFTGQRTMSAGRHDVRVEYFEVSGPAQIEFWWHRQESFPEWKGEYFGNPTVSGQPVVVRNDVDINFDWGQASPASGVPADSFSVRWTRRVFVTQGGVYRLALRVDDGARVWVDGSLVLDAWRVGSAADFAVDRYLDAGWHDFEVRYFDDVGRALVRFTWTPLAPTATATVTQTPTATATATSTATPTATASPTGTATPTATTTATGTATATPTATSTATPTTTTTGTATATPTATATATGTATATPTATSTATPTATHTPTATATATGTATATPTATSTATPTATHTPTATATATGTATVTPTATTTATGTATATPTATSTATPTATATATTTATPTATATATETATATTTTTTTATATETATATTTTTATATETATATPTETETAMLTETTTATTTPTAMATATPTERATATPTATATATKTMTATPTETATATATVMPAATETPTATATATATPTGTATPTATETATATQTATPTPPLVVRTPISPPSPPVIRLSIAISPTVAWIGTPVTVTGEDWPAGETVQVAIVSARARLDTPVPPPLAETVVDPDGSFSVQFLVPESAVAENQAAVQVVAFTADLRYGGVARLLLAPTTGYLRAAPAAEPASTEQPPRRGGPRP